MRVVLDYWISTDGGALASGTDDSAGHGSYHLEARTGQRQTIRLDFGRGLTNSKADNRTLTAALGALVTRIQRAGTSPSRCGLRIHTDSQLLAGQLTQGWQLKAANLRSLVDEAAALILAFGRSDPSAWLGTCLVKVPRHETVRVLGR